ncbi:MAG: hypothetical protein ABW065_03475 [Solirubrobacterales bacterium]
MAPAARGDYDPVGSGATKLTLDRSFLALMQSHGVELKAVAPAKLSGRTISFPVAGGKLDPSSGKGTIEHEGALRFVSGSGSIPLKALQLKMTQRHAPFSAKAGGGQLKIGSAGALSMARHGFGEKVAVNRLRLSSKLATRLAKKLNLRGVIRDGLPFASARTIAVPEAVTVLAGGDASVTLDPAFAAKLSSLFVAVNPIFPAEHPGPFTLSIVGGTVAPDLGSGRLETGGAIEFLQLGGGQIFWAEGWFDFAAGAYQPEVDSEPSPPYAGRVGRIQVAPLSLAGATVSSDAGRRRIDLAGGTLSMDGGMAETFNEVFAKPQGKSGVFAAGEPVASISFSAQGQ